MQETQVCHRSGKIPPAVEQLSPCTTTVEPVLQSLGAATPEPGRPRACASWGEKPPQWEAHPPQLKRTPRLAASREKPAWQGTPSTAKIKLIAAILMTSKQILVVWISLVNFRPTFYWSLNTFPSVNNSFKTEFWIFPSKPSYCHSSLKSATTLFCQTLQGKKYLC